MPASTPVPIRPFVVDFVREAGHTVTGPSWMHVAGPRTNVVIDEHEGTLTARRVDGEDVLGARLVTTEPQVMERFLVTEVVAGWRRAHGLRPLGDRSLRRPRSHEVVRHPDGTSAVRRRSDGALVAWRLSRADAARLAATCEHPVETVVAAAKERQGRPVWTGSTLAPLVRSLVLLVVLVGALAAIKLPRHVGSWEFVVGSSAGLLACVAGVTWFVVRTRRGRRRTGDTLDRARPGAATWRCLAAPGFAAAMAAAGVREKLPTRRQIEVTLVETPTGIEVWRNGRTEPLREVPWDRVGSVDCEPVSASPVCVLVVRDVDGGRVPVILLRDRTGAQRPATAQATEEYAAHLRDLYLTPR
ncbi:hypothetical protein [Cellulomonas sp. Leaf334]|uniref:hypothetical protein n=1 Tax=Cellulomonas sp. Leaf334 TaxID=1736339 RepID=UPI0006F5EE43|nr:hypothetical protein [Cellulomonas sp. Leaf334]KQR08611.1 hypothetical protein ASF78_20465 [Cellulomonas sp. Leaf334]